MIKVSYITEDGFQRLKHELDHLVSVERPSISKQIAEARDKGDLSENAEYEAAKEAQGMLGDENFQTAGSDSQFQDNGRFKN